MKFTTSPPPQTVYLPLRTGETWAITQAVTVLSSKPKSTTRNRTAAIGVAVPAIPAKRDFHGENTYSWKQ
jgi:hypothetical protein